MIFFDLDDTLLDDRAATSVALDALRRLRPGPAVEDPGFVETWRTYSDAGLQRFLVSPARPLTALSVVDRVSLSA